VGDVPSKGARIVLALEMPAYVAAGVVSWAVPTGPDALRTIVHKKYQRCQRRQICRDAPVGRTAKNERSAWIELILTQFPSLV
jgi:hypothetical protein